MADPNVDTKPSAWVPVQSRLTAHYSQNRAFFPSDSALLDSIASIRHIPCVAVQGANDLVCPPWTAHELHKAWPEMELRIVPGAGHSMYDQGLLQEVLDATDMLRDRHMMHLGGGQQRATRPADGK